jgi:hypothetical protein
MTAIERLALLVSVLLLIAAVVMLVVQWNDSSSAANWLAGGAVLAGLGTYLSITRRGKRQQR